MKNYKIFLLMLIISFCIMYGVMFLNVASLDHLYLSLNRLYMALLMVSPMAILMLILMRKMFKNKKLNAVILVASLLVFIITVIFLREQIFIADKQYMQAMIPHHSSAILTSQEASIQNPEVKELADQIIETQIREIELMKQYLQK
ncbi:MAG: DUF305 domain-containing protein [Candidatus Buchananbacteria bacterium]|nr:DUF305 domain-containing protein [Candidatus Buchananbacteria bacterium]